MAERQSKIDAVANLAAEVARSSATRETQLLSTLNEQGKILGDLREAIARIDGRTENFVRDTARLEKVTEAQQSQIESHAADLGMIKGVGAAVAFLLSCGEAAMALFLRRA